MTGRTRKQYAHRKTTNEKILETMQNNPNKWLSSNEIASLMHVDFSRGVGKRLNYLCAETPELEMQKDKRTGKLFYRHNSSSGGESE